MTRVGLRPSVDQKEQQMNKITIVATVVAGLALSSVAWASATSSGQERGDAGTRLGGTAVADGPPALGAVSGPVGGQGESGTASPTPAPDSAASTVQPTAIAVTAPVTPRWTRGVDGRIHVDYDLLTTNWVSGTVTLESVQVLDPRGRVLKNMTGTDLTARTHLISDEDDATAAIPASASAATIVDVVLPAEDGGSSSSSVPATLTHRVTYRLPSDLSPALRAFIGSVEVDGPATEVERTPPTVIAAPFDGGGWINVVGCCDTSKHRNLLYTANGQWTKGETFAIDWWRLRDGSPFSDDGSRNADYYNWGAPIRSVASGVVVRAVDGRPDLPPNCIPENQCDPGLTTPDSFNGNYVVVRIGAGVYADYAHLQEGSVAVQVGQRVRTGQQLGLLGDSGNSTAPHLHFGLIDGPDFTTAESLPWVFNRFRFDGFFDPPSGKIIGEPHDAHREYPLLNGLITVP
jgi:Peptidase family M23